MLCVLCTVWRTAVAVVIIYAHINQHVHVSTSHTLQLTVMSNLR